MNYVGVDLHKEQSWFYVMAKTGKRISSKSISNKPAVLNEYFKTIVGNHWNRAKNNHYG